MKKVISVLTGFFLFVALSMGFPQKKAESQSPASSKYHFVQLNGHRFQLPVGYTIELAAVSPQTERPITASLDDQGRLYVAESSGSNEKVDVQLMKKPHRILRLEDKDGDGKYEHSSIFADQMMFPEGTLWMQGSLYVAAPPSIWKLTDSDGDGVADKREEWFKGKTLTGCANDLHGPYEGRDGWIYWCKGAFAQQDYEIRGKKWSTKASHIFRCKPDGSGFEPVMTGGMDNPVDTVFTPEGERVFTTTFFQYPAAGLRDGLIHAVYGGIYGKLHDVIRDHPWTSHDVMPVLTHMGAAAPCGLHCYESESLGEGFRGNLFACQFNLRKVSRHILLSDGSGMKSVDSDFVVSDQVDFHPTDVLEDVDGSLLIVDTGGWYKLCCPTSQLVKPDVRGAIYRVRKNDAASVKDPTGKSISWETAGVEELANLLKDSRWMVRKIASQKLSVKGDAAVPYLVREFETAKSISQKQNVIWTLARLGSSSALDYIASKMPSEKEQVVQACLNAVSLHRYKPAMSALLKVLENGSDANKRLAIECLGRIGAVNSVGQILKASIQAKDRAFAHAATYALYELGDFKNTKNGLNSDSARVQSIALHALELIDPAGLKAGMVLDAMKTNDRSLTDSCWWLISRHPEWGGEVQPFLIQELAKVKDSEMGEWVVRLAALAKSPAIADMLGRLVVDEKVCTSARIISLRSMAQSTSKDVPASWLAGWKKLLETSNEAFVNESLQAIQSLKLNASTSASLQPHFQGLFGNTAFPPDTRLKAGALLASGFKIADESQWKLLNNALDPSQSVSNRLRAAEILAKARLDSKQLLSLCRVIERASPFEVDRLLDCFSSNQDDAVGLELTKALAKSKALGSLKMDVIRDKTKRYGANTQASLKNLEEKVKENNSKNLEKMETLLALIPTSDIRRGQLVFQSAKSACYSCHAIGYLGGKIGPDLTRIGQIRTERDLLESILFPSASFVRSYEPTKVITASGKIFQGLLKGDDPREIVLTTGPDQTVKISKEDIESMEPGTVSVMPAGLDQQFTPQELADLVAFLKACK